MQGSGDLSLSLFFFFYVDCVLGLLVERFASTESNIEAIGFFVTSK